jgi:hypothetical protein
MKNSPRPAHAATAHELCLFEACGPPAFALLDYESRGLRILRPDLDLLDLLVLRGAYLTTIELGRVRGTDDGIGVPHRRVDVVALSAGKGVAISRVRQSQHIVFIAA